MIVLTVPVSGSTQWPQVTSLQADCDCSSECTILLVFDPRLSENCDQPADEFWTAMQNKLHSKNLSTELDSIFLNEWITATLTWTVKMKTLSFSISFKLHFLFESSLLSVLALSTPTAAQPSRTFCILCAATLASSSESDSLCDVELCEAELQGEEHSGENR